MQNQSILRATHDKMLPFLLREGAEGFTEQEIKDEIHRRSLIQSTKDRIEFAKNIKRFSDVYYLEMILEYLNV